MLLREKKKEKKVTLHALEIQLLESVLEGHNDRASVMRDVINDTTQSVSFPPASEQCVELYPVYCLTL